MEFDFRFLVMCRTPVNQDGVISLHDVVNTIYLPEDAFPADVKMYAVVGAVLTRAMKGKHLDLMAWQLDKKGARETLVKYRGTPLILPEQIGAVCLPYAINVPALTPGLYGFDLFDRDGAFGQREKLLATYLYGICSR